MFLHVPVVVDAASYGTPPTKSPVDGAYHVRILLQQWEIQAFDEVKVESILKIGNNDPFIPKAWLPYVHNNIWGSFEKNSTIFFDVYSKDVQHGFSINQLGLAIASIRPTGNQIVGQVVQSGKLQWPNKDLTIEAYCHIFCGLGHPDMKFKFVIGAGSPNYGLDLYYFAFAFNAIVFAAVGYSLIKKIVV